MTTDPQPGPDIAEQFGTGGWQFTPAVANVFDEHVRASVPFYDDIQKAVAETADWLLPQNGLVADLGCSTGNTDLAILHRHKDRIPTFACYDESPEMLSKAVAAIGALSGGRVAHHITDLRDGQLNHENADMTLLLFVLQFLPAPATRLTVLTAAREHAAPTGALVVAEKIRVTDTRWAEIATDISHDYKAEAGVTDTAIRAKARALRGVLHPYPLDVTTSLIREAGWHAPDVLFRWHQWVLLGAYASP